ncbi:hypothetical protein ACVJBD_007485 [Rhizobium mongolense]
MEETMHAVAVADRSETSSAIRTDLGAIFVSLELSRSSWLITSLSPGGGEKLSKHSVRSGDVSALFSCFDKVREKARARMGRHFQEAGLDGFWIHRVLSKAGIESYVVDPASIAVSRRSVQGLQDRGTGTDLVGECRKAEVDAFSGITFALPV